MARRAPEPLSIFDELVDEVAGSAWTPPWVRRRAAAWLGYRVVHEAPLPGGSLRVLERGSVRHLRFGEAWEDQSAIDLDDPLRPLLPYTRVATVGLALPTGLGAVLHVGLGGGTLPRLVQAVAPDAAQHAVEPYAAVVDAARRWFVLPEGVAVTVAHADATLATLPGIYDLVYLDAFSPAGEPVAQSEATFAGVRRLLRADGWLVVNVTADVRLAIRALHRSFSSVGWLTLPGVDQHVLVASDTPSLAGVRVRARAISPALGTDVEALVDALTWAEGSIVAAPVESAG